jgi:hypothetical protein
VFEQVQVLDSPRPKWKICARSSYVPKVSEGPEGVWGGGSWSLSLGSWWDIGVE